MPDSIFSHGDTQIINIVRRSSQERLAPLAAEPEKQRRIEPEIIAEFGELGAFGAATRLKVEGRTALEAGYVAKLFATEPADSNCTAWAVTAFWPSARWKGSTAPLASARSTRPPPTCRS